jgi:hypothetical protein
MFVYGMINNMNYKLTKHISSDDVYWLVEEIKKTLEHEYFTYRDCNWEIFYADINTLSLANNFYVNFKERLPIYKNSFKRGDIHPPIYVAPDSWSVIDGCHKILALKQLGTKTVPVCKGITPGDSTLVKDEVYAPLVNKKPASGSLKTPQCIICGYSMNKKDNNYSCPKCKRSFLSPNITGCTLVNLPRK